MSETLRLDKFLCETLGLSRKQAKRALKQADITVNGEAVRSAQHPVGPTDSVQVNGEHFAWPTSRYFMLHKPAGMVCDRDEAFYPSVFELFEDEPRAERLHLAGRLDVDTTGLVLVTDDGQFSHRITSPRHECPKRYHAVLSAPITADAVRALQAGFHLRSEDKPCAPAQVEVLEPLEIRITVTEGRYHLVKRLCAAIGAPVEQLHREAIGSVELDAGLAEGEWRGLSEDELERLCVPTESSR